MPGNELRELIDFTTDSATRTVTVVEDTHRAVARRAFDGVGRVGTPVRGIHDRIAGAAYTTVRSVTGALGRVAAVTLEAAMPRQAGVLTRSRGGRAVLGALNGAFGDAFADRQSDLALPMTLRHGGRDVRPGTVELARAFPSATARLVVFVHGLCETDEAWQLYARARPGVAPETYGSRLARDLGFTPLSLRYNTGLHVSDNGRLLSKLLEAVVDTWPKPVDEIALVGHSMGGLVARSACHHGHGSGSRWVTSVRHVVCLGSPHLGSPIEKAANVAAWLLASTAESRPLAALLNTRSSGIKDLRFGYLVDEDWTGRDPDSLLHDNRHDVPLLESATHHFVAAAVAGDPDGGLAALVGDSLVLLPSASGRSRRGAGVPFALEDGRRLGGLHHLRLLNDPAVHEVLSSWLGERPPSPDTPGVEGGAEEGPESDDVRS